MLQPHNTTAAPAPWQLTGEGYVVAVWMPQAQALSAEHTEHHAKTKKASLWPRGRIQLLIFAHYTQSNVGPYDELLHIPQLSQGVVDGYPSIDKIYVSTMASVVNGQQNWGIPKQLAVFNYQQATEPQSTELIQLTTSDQQPIVRIELQKGGFRFPVNTALVPARLRTLVQDWQGKRFYTVPEATGQACFAKVKDWWFDPFHFPDLSAAKVISAFKITDFQMAFPQAEIISLHSA